jgi:hypothetical protein
MPDHVSTATGTGALTNAVIPSNARHPADADRLPKCPNDGSEIDINTESRGIPHFVRNDSGSDKPALTVAFRMKRQFDFP